jgi:hypothetical protein
MTVSQSVRLIQNLYILLIGSMLHTLYSNGVNELSGIRTLPKKGMPDK